MAPTKSLTREKSVINAIKSFHRDYVNVNYAKSLLFDPAKLSIVSIGILIAELLLNVLIVQRVRYTEIDWIAYMQECEGFLNGTTNYALLKGNKDQRTQTLLIHNLIYVPRERQNGEIN